MLLTIGDFAKLSRVSTRMLRHYDALGLLKPVRVDPATRYRYYSIDQLPRLRRICALRDLSFRLDDILLLLDDDEQPRDLRQLLRRKQRELRRRIAEDLARVQRIEARLGTLEEYPMETQHEREALAQLLSEQYRVDAVKLELVYAVTPQKYTARDADGAVWDVYVARTDAPGDNIYNGWLEGYSGHPVTDYLLDRAGLLLQLEAQQYPTQRVVRTYAGEVLGAWAGWSALVTTEWHPLLGSFHDALGKIQRLPLPRALIHGDPYIDRAATADDGTLTFYEWHSGGEGVALLDLGRLLYGCHLDRDSQWPWSITPSKERIGAVMDGYQTRRRLSDMERASLLEAIRFGIGYGAALHLARGLSTGWTPNLEQKLAARKQWFEATGEISAIASERMHHIGTKDTQN